MTRYRRLKGVSKDRIDPSAAGAAATGATTGGAEVTNGHGAKRVTKGRPGVNTPPAVFFGSAATPARPVPPETLGTACYAPADSGGGPNAAVGLSAAPRLRITRHAKVDPT